MGAREGGRKTAKREGGGRDIGGGGGGGILKSTAINIYTKVGLKLVVKRKKKKSYSSTYVRDINTLKYTLTPYPQFPLSRNGEKI